jgi:quercetin dioxygenase-like cupin family protein
MKKYAMLSIIALCCALTVASGLLETSDQTKASDESAVQSQGINANEGLGTEFAQVNLFQFAEENPLDPKVGVLTKKVGLGKNASINLTQIAPGHRFGAHYHRARDEINFIVKGEANMTIASQDHLVKAGDLIYIPPGTVHDFAAVGTENFELICVFSPPFDGKDRIFV